MGSELSWEGNYHPSLVGNYRNFPVVGYREPFFSNKEYVAHYNLEISMASYMDLFVRSFERIDNSSNESHLITALAYFHNKFLNEIHPFADGNGRVCRLVMGTLMMKNGCPPVFSHILSHNDMVEYIHTLISCEDVGNDRPFIEFLAIGMSEYMEDRVRRDSK